MRLSMCLQAPVGQSSFVRLSIVDSNSQLTPELAASLDALREQHEVQLLHAVMQHSCLQPCRLLA